MTTLCSGLRCVSAAEHQTAEQYSKTDKDKTPKASPKKQSIMEYLPGLPQDTKPLRSCSGNGAKMLLKSQFGIKCHSNITRSSDSFSTVTPIVNAGDWGCIVRDLETIIVLVLLAFYFISQRSHHSPTFTRSRLRDSATATLWPGDGTTAIKLESSA